MAFIENRRLKRKLLSIGAAAGLILLLVAVVVLIVKSCGTQKPKETEDDKEPAIQTFSSEIPTHRPDKTESITEEPTFTAFQSIAPEPTPMQSEAPKLIGRGDAVIYLDVSRGVSTEDHELAIVNGRIAMRVINDTEEDMYAAEFSLPAGCRIINASVDCIAARFDISENDVLGIPFLHELKPNESIAVFFEFVWEGDAEEPFVLPHPSDDAEYGLSAYVASDRELFFSPECEALKQDEGFMYRFDHLGINKLTMIFKEEV